MDRYGPRRDKVLLEYRYIYNKVQWVRLAPVSRGLQLKEYLYNRLHDIVSQDSIIYGLSADPHHHKIRAPPTTTAMKPHSLSTSVPSAPEVDVEVRLVEVVVDEAFAD
jgi:hypothetical protein